MTKFAKSTRINRDFDGFPSLSHPIGNGSTPLYMFTTIERKPNRPTRFTGLNGVHREWTSPKTNRHKHLYLAIWQICSKIALKWPYKVTPRAAMFGDMVDVDPTGIFQQYHKNDFLWLNDYTNRVACWTEGSRSCSSPFKLPT